MQTVRRRVVLASIVLSVGIVSALPFYREGPPADLNPSPAKTEAPAAPEPASTLLQVSTRDSGMLATSNDIPHSSPGSFDHSPFPEQAKKPGRLQPESPLPTSHPAAREMVPGAAPIQRVDGGVLEKADRGGRTDSRERTAPRNHRIIDGDTLEDLASRFLGDRNRWREILEANRDVLTSQDLLPIGKQIRIPSRSEQPANSAVTLTPEDPNLVPIPWQPH